MKINLHKDLIVNIDENDDIERQLADTIQIELEKEGFDTYQESDAQVVVESTNIRVWIAVNYNKNGKVDYDLHHEDRHDEEHEAIGVVNRKTWSGVLTYVKNNNY